MKRLKDFFFKPLDEYQINELTYEDLKYKQYFLYRKCKILNIFKMLKLIKQAKLIDGEKEVSQWIIMNTKIEYKVFNKEYFRKGAGIINN